MHYGMTFEIEVHDYDTGTDETLVTRASDYLQMQMWKTRGLKGVPEAAADVYGNYALLWFALRREDRLADIGLPEDGELTLGTLDRMAARVSTYTTLYKGDEVPLETASAR